MRLRLIGALVGLVVAILIVFGIPLRSYVQSVERDRLLKTLERDAFILAGHAKETLNTNPGEVLPSLEPHIQQHSKKTDARVLVVNSRGIAIATNDESLDLGSDFTNRPEIATALQGEPAVGRRESTTLGETLVFVAVPVQIGNDVVGAVRFSNPESVIDDEIRERSLGIAVAALLTIMVAIGIAIPVALGIARPLARLRAQTDRLAAGDFDSTADEEDGPVEVRDLSRSFNVMARRLGNLTEIQQQFTSSVSHQLRTPLTALRLRLDQAQDAIDRDPHRVGEAIEASQNEVSRLQEMIEQLLKLSRLEGKEISVVSVDASEIVRSRVELWGPLAEEKDVAIEVVGLESAQCEVVEGGLEQIVDNFVDNALTVAPTDSCITISVQGDSGRVVVEVIDEGPGLSDEELARVFDRFWRAPQATSTSGSGLGLAIVRQLAIASGAEVSLRNRSDGRSGIVSSAVFRRST